MSNKKELEKLMDEGETPTEVIEDQIDSLKEIKKQVNDERATPLFLLKDHPHLETLYLRYKDEADADMANLKQLQFDIAGRGKAFWDTFARQASGDGVSIGAELPGYMYTSVRNGVVFAATRDE